MTLFRRLPGRPRPSGPWVIGLMFVVFATSGVAQAQSVDTAFDPGANEYVGTIKLLPDGKILVGGLFTTLGGGVLARRRATISAYSIRMDL